MVEIAAVAGNVTESEVHRKYEILTKRLIESNRTITTMESCTSGLIASLITDTEGSSAVLKGAYITYSNESKIQQGVPKEVIDTYGVYAVETAEAMAAACRASYKADYGIGVTGSFGNVDPNNADSVPGEVFFAIAGEGETLSYHCSIPVQDTRFQYKLYMADLIVDRLLAII